MSFDQIKNHLLGINNNLIYLLFFAAKFIGMEKILYLPQIFNYFGHGKE